MKTFKTMRGPIEEALPDILANHSAHLKLHAGAINAHARMLILFTVYVVVSSVAIIGHLLGGW